MNLPKYMPGVVAIVREEPNADGSFDIFPEGIGMYVISDAFIEHEVWHYQNYDGKIQFHEHEIIGVVNNGYFVQADRFNGVTEAPEHSPTVESELEDLMSKNTAEEEEFIKKNSKRPTKIEVKDEDGQAIK